MILLDGVNLTKTSEAPRLGEAGGPSWVRAAPDDFRNRRSNLQSVHGFLHRVKHFHRFPTPA
jgi:hypothetical protein